MRKPPEQDPHETGRQGGLARAERLPAEMRSEIARHAAQKRWGTTALRAEYAGDLNIGNLTLACAVLDDGSEPIRVINQGTMLTALGRSRRPRGGDAGTILFAANLQPYISDELAETLKKPITYITPGGKRALGYPAGILPDICEVYLRARDADPSPLRDTQLRAAVAADILIRGLARVGIVALVDEVTGYQEVRARHELEEILAAYVQPALRTWIRTFPDEFFQEIYRLQGWEYKSGTSKRTPYVGHLVNKYIYEQLPPGVLDELRRLNPRTERGYRAHKHFQFLTADTGNPHLDRQIATVTTLLRISHSKEEFEDLFDRAFSPQMRLPLAIPVENEGS